MTFLSSGQAKKRVLRRVLRGAVLGFFSLLITTPLASFAATASVVAPNTPTLNGPDQGEVVTENSPVITGWVTDGLLVEVHIDGQFNGWATIQESDTETDSFYYTPYLPLSAGVHALHVRSKDPHTGARSEPTQEITFYVADALPTPTLLEPVVTSSAPQQPIVVGLTYGSTMVEVFVDGESQGVVTVEGDSTEVRDFALQTDVLSTDTEHLVYVVASDTLGRVSAETAVMSVTVLGASDDRVVSPIIEDDSLVDDTITDDEVVLGEATDVNGDDVDTDDHSDESENGENEDNVVATTDDDEDDSDRSALVTWIVVIAVLVVVLALRLRGKNTAQSSFDHAARSVFKDEKNPPKDSDNDPKQDDIPPPSPPSSSSY